MTPDGVRELERHGINVLRRGRRRRGRVDHRRRLRGRRRRHRADRRRRVVAADGGQGEGAAGREFGVPAPRPHAVHLPPPRRLPGGRQGAARGRARPALAYETVQLDNGALPLLAPMSEVAGRLAPQMGAHFLERHNGGRGVLMGGAPGVRPAQGRRARRRQRRLERGVDRRRHGGRGRAARQEPRPAALGRPDPPGPDHDAGVEPRRDRAQRGRRRPRDRRRARRRRARAGGRRPTTWCGR